MSELPPGWALTTLGDIVTEVRNGVSAKPDRDDGLPILRISAVRPMRLDVEDTRHLPYDFQGAYTNRLVEGDLLFTRYNGNRDLVGVCARVRRLSREMVYPDKLIRVRVDRTVADAAFVERAVHVPEARDFIADKLKTSAGQIGISDADLKRLPIPLAPLPEQKRIADKLDAVLARVDACRERLDRVPGILKRFRQSVLAAATSGELTREWRDGVDAEWEERSIEQFCPDERYALAIGPFGSNLKVADYRGEGVPLVFVREIRARKFGNAGTKYVTQEKAAELRAHAVRPGDLLITKMGDPPGDTAIYPLDRPPAIMTADVVCMRVDPRIANTSFVGYAIESPLGRKRIGEITAGVAQQKISLERFRTMLLPVPPLPEQVEIARRVGELFELAERLERRIRAARDSIDRSTPCALAKAFRGELVPQDPKDEPASALLARIATERSAIAASSRPRSPRASRPPRALKETAIEDSEAAALAYRERMP